MRRAEEIRLATKDLRIQHRSRTLDPVTVSIGVAEYPADGTIAEALIRAADQALYRAKNQGRDRVAPATETAPAD